MLECGKNFGYTWERNMDEEGLKVVKNEDYNLEGSAV